MLFQKGVESVQTVADALAVIEPVNRKHQFPVAEVGPRAGDQLPDGAQIADHTCSLITEYDDRVRVYFSGDNLVTWTALKSKYIDPEQFSTDGSARVYPFAKTFSFGLDITF